AKRAVKVDSLSPAAKAAARDVGLDNNRTALLSAKRAGGNDPSKEVEALRAISDVKKEQKKTARAKREQDLAAKQCALPQKRYGAILADAFSLGHCANVAASSRGHEGMGIRVQIALRLGQRQGRDRLLVSQQS